MDDSQRRLAFAGAAVVAVLVLVGGAVALGVGPFGGGGGNGGDGGYSAGGGDGGGATATETPPPTGTVYTEMPSEGSPAPFAFDIVAIEKCGQTCRNVTVELINQQNRTAHNVSVFTRMYAGNSTAEGDRVWKGTEDVGTMASGESVTRTQTVELSTSEGFAIQQEDGWITILTTVDSAEVTVTFKDRRNVT